jgi:hypothetical protein
MVSEDLDGSFLSPGGSKWTKEEAQQMFKLIEKINNKYFMEELFILLFSFPLSIVPFKCSLCSFLSGYLDNCYDHILEAHKDWRDETGFYCMVVVIDN